MKLPSITLLRERALAAFTRFPLVLTAAVIGTLVILFEANAERWVLPCALGLPLLTAVELLGERAGWSRPNRLLVGAVCMGLLLLYGITLSERPNQGEMIRFAMLDAGFHLLVAFAPFLRRGQERGFWQFNQTLFIGFATAMIYSLTLTIGLELALASVDRLFEVHVDGELYAKLAVIIFGVFNTWFFLGLIPTDFDELDRIDIYPRGLKIFAQYVLLPLVTVYLVILYLYTGKIMLQWSWPNGWVSGLVLGYGVAGILSLLLLYPLRDQEENRWIAIFSRWFYAALVPLDLLLSLAIWRRISDYGFTEERYIVALVALWLGGISIYHLLGRRSIKVVPVSLCILALITSYGPWSARSVSVADQFGRLRKELVQRRMIADGTFRPSPDSLSDDTQRSIRTMIDYLDERGEFSRVTALAPKFSDTLNRWDLIGTLGVNEYDNAGPPLHWFNIAEPKEVLVDGYSLAVNVLLDDIPRTLHRQLPPDGREVMVRIDTVGEAIRIFVEQDTVLIRLDSLMRVVIQEEATQAPAYTQPTPDSNDVPVERLLIAEGTGRSWRARAETDFLWFHYAEDAGHRRMTLLEAWILIGRKR